jgi:hypothetical protein
MTTVASEEELLKGQREFARRLVAAAQPLFEKRS